MAFLRLKKRGKCEYWYCVKSYREKGKTKQKQIYLGTAETIFNQRKKKKKKF